MQQQQLSSVLLASLALAVAVQSVAGVITVQIGGANRLTTLNRNRERYSCYWDCDLVGCQIAHDDDECAYDCEKICRVRYDYAAGRSDAPASSGGSSDELKPKSGALDSLVAKLEAKSAEAGSDKEVSPELLGGKWRKDSPDSGNYMTSTNQLADQHLTAGTSVRLHLPRNASARNFGIWERCAADANTGKLTEKPFNL